MGCQSRGTHSGGKTRTQAGGEEGTGNQSRMGSTFHTQGFQEFSEPREAAQRPGIDALSAPKEPTPTIP